MPSHGSPVVPLPMHRHLATESLVEVLWGRIKKFILFYKKEH